MYLEALNDKSRSIFEKLKNFKEFYLAGGTALALQIGHRRSFDFDLFSEKEIDKNLLQKIKNLFGQKEISVSVNTVDELTIFIDGIKLSFIKYPFPVLFDFVSFEGVRMLCPKEIAAAKAYAIGRRGEYKDYVDLYFILQQKIASLREILEIAEKKYGAEFNGRLFLEQLLYVEDIEEVEVFLLKEEKGGRLDKKRIIDFFEEEIRREKLLNKN